MHASLLLGLMFALDSPTSSTEADVSIEGEWVVESWLENGEADNGLRGMMLTFREGKFTTSVRVAGAYAVLSARPPRAIDFRNSEGGLCRGIYKLDGGKLTLCVATQPGGPRPAWFTAAVGAPCPLMVLK